MLGVRKMKIENKSRLLLYLAALGVIVFAIASSTLPFKGGLFSLLFPKPPSLAAGPNDWNQVQKDPQRTGYSSEVLGTTFAVKWTYPFQPERVHPAVQAIVYDDGTGSKVFVGTEMGNIYAIDATNGAKKWNYSTGSQILSSVAADNGKVYFGAMDGVVYALNSVDGTQVWKQQLSSKGFSSSPLLADSKVMIGGRDGKFYGLDPATGNKLWEYDALSPILQTPAWNSGKAFFGTLDMNVHAVNTLNGSGFWKKQLTGAGFKDNWPIASGGKVIIRAYPKGTFNAGVRPGSPFGFYDASSSTWYSQNGALVASGNATQAPTFISSQDNVISSYNSNPNAYTNSKSLYILDENSGQEVFTVPHFDVQSLGGTPQVGCIDKDNKLVMPVTFLRSGWGRLDLNYVGVGSTAASSGRITDILFDNTFYQTNVPRGMGNDDESLAPTCVSNMIFSMHLEEANANFTGAFVMEPQDPNFRQWIQIQPGYKNKQITTNNQHSTNPATISNGMVFHIAWNELIARSTGTPFVPSPTATASATPSSTPTPTP